MNYTLTETISVYGILLDKDAVSEAYDSGGTLKTLVIQNRGNKSVWVDTFGTPAVGAGIEIGAGETFSVDTLSFKDINLTPVEDTEIGINVF